MHLQTDAQAHVSSGYNKRQIDFARKAICPVPFECSPQRHD